MVFTEGIPLFFEQNKSRINKQTYNIGVLRKCWNPCDETFETIDEFP